MNYHDWLYRTRRLMAEVEAAMSEMAGHIETDGALAEEEGLDRLKSNAVQIDIIACCP